MGFDFFFFPSVLLVENNMEVEPESVSIALPVLAYSCQEDMENSGNHVQSEGSDVKHCFLKLFL